VTLALTLIQPVSNWTHWATLRRHPCLSRAATSSSSQVNPIFRRSLLTTLLQFALGRPGPLLYHGTCQYSACCGMRWWSIRKTCPSQRSRLSLSMLSTVCCPAVAYPENFHRGCVTPIYCLKISTYATHCFCRERNFDRRTRN